MISKLEINKDGTKLWCNEHGRFHREDGPAIEFPNGHKVWYINGECHREDGPAVEYINGDKEWFVHGKFHRKNGPAVDYANGYKRWYYHGQKIDCQSQDDFERLIELLPFE